MSSLSRMALILGSVVLGYAVGIALLNCAAGVSEAQIPASVAAEAWVNALAECTQNADSGPSVHLCFTTLEPIRISFMKALDAGPE